ncbi:MAG: hypothetical protein KDK30_13885 [Leptospiraceae bacterium]|nr:hypothetical protein [Leptospiraceae bacterium]
MKIKPYKSTAEDLKKEISTMRAVARRNARIEPYFLFKIAVLGIQRANTLVLMSRLSQEIQNIKNDSYLNDARRELNSLIGDLMKVVGEDIDGTLTENQELLPLIAQVSWEQRLHLCQGFKESIQNVKNAMGESSKWRWSFPDMHMRLATLARNLLDFKAYERISKDPSHDDYRPLQEYFQFMMEESQLAAQEFRTKYELSTRDVSDLQKIQRIFEFQKKIYSFSGQKEELKRVSTSLDNVNEMIESLIGGKKDKDKDKSRKK